jgi:hypothetical protein
MRGGSSRTYRHRQSIYEKHHGVAWKLSQLCDVIFAEEAFLVTSRNAFTAFLHFSQTFFAVLVHHKGEPA